jgi:hypothetical protein
MDMKKNIFKEFEKNKIKYKNFDYQIPDDRKVKFQNI